MTVFTPVQLISTQQGKLATLFAAGQQVLDRRLRTIPSFFIAV
jgi:hypothetical protein